MLKTIDVIWPRRKQYVKTPVYRQKSLIDETEEIIESNPITCKMEEQKLKRRLTNHEKQPVQMRKTSNKKLSGPSMLADEA